MKCRNARKLVTEFIDGLQNDTKRLELEQHLVDCSECDKFAMQMNRSMDLLHRAPQETTSDNFAWKVRLKINQERNAVSERSASYGIIVRAWNLRYASAAVAAAAVVLVGGLLMVKNGLAPISPRDDGLPDVTLTEAPAAAETDQSRPSSDAGAGQRPSSPPRLIPSDRTGTGFRAVDSNPSLARRQGMGRIIGVDLIDRYEPMSVAQMDSLVHTELDGLSPDEQARYLSQYINVLQRHMLRTQVKRHTSR